VLKNLGAVLKAASFDYSDVVQVQAYLADLNDYKAMNAVYATYFSESKPARAVVEAARIPRDALVEIMMVAVKS
jgi:2-iminobutanoate/2-iminopropanoate deaminase